MSPFSRVAILVLICFGMFGTGCANVTSRGIPVGGGWRMSMGFESNTVVVTNASTLPGDLFMNGGFIRTLEVGDTFVVSLGGFVRNNILLFKAFSLAGGQRILRGVSSSSFQGGASYTVEWTIRYVQPI